MRAWGLTDGSAGMIAQVRALAQAMDVTLEEKTITVNAPWRMLPNLAFDGGFSRIFPVTKQTFPSPHPDLIISCGRKSALVSAALKTNAKCIHIQDPQMSPAHFDVVIAMEHDRISGKNIISIPYALHDITPEKLSRAEQQWKPSFAHLPHPWNAVLIGGSTNKYNFLFPAMKKLISDMEQINGSLLITTSRRTGAENIRLLESHFRGNGRVFLYTGEGENPYLGMLACADKIYVTNDSVNMMSEALASGKPLEILPLHGHENTKPTRFAARIGEVEFPQEMMKSLAQSVRQVLAAGA
jgi:mitochondrial fission protein ELM1